MPLHLPRCPRCAPLQGWFYRELRQSLVDMEDLFTLLRTPTKLPEGSRKLPDAPLVNAPAAAPGAGHLNSGGAAQPAGAAAATEEGALEERRHSNGAAGSSGAVSGNGTASTRGLRLELRDVRFGYGGKEGRQVLKGVSLVAHPGESVAIVGEAATRVRAGI